MGKIKLVVFDIDNVLFDVGYFEKHDKVAASSWGAIWKELDDEEDHIRLKRNWSEGKYKTYTEWQIAALKVFKRRGLTEERFLKVVYGLPLMKGAKETVRELKRKGILTATISGGFFEIAMRARKELGIDFPFATCSIAFKDGLMAEWAVLPYDYEGKAHIFNALAKSLGILPKECAFICDGVNDIPLARVVGLPIAFGARDELKRHCRAVVDSKDMRDILKYVT
jgi:phosphoserine phosphatase